MMASVSVRNMDCSFWGTGDWGLGTGDRALEQAGPRPSPGNLGTGIREEARRSAGCIVAGRGRGHEKAPESASAAGAIMSINFVGLRFVLLFVK